MYRGCLNRNNRTLLAVAGICLLSIILYLELSSAWALVAGAALACFTNNPLVVHTEKLSRLLLKTCVVLLGFRLNITQVASVSGQALELSALSIGVTFLAGLLLAQKLGLKGDQKHLITSGTAICGGSAIATVGSSIRSSGQDMSVSLAVIFLLNAVALVIFPHLGNWLSLSQEQFGLWAAMAIHDTSSVIGAAAAYGEQALDIAVTVKLVRALWIIPVAMIYVFFFKRDGSGICIPWFIGLFCLAVLANSFTPVISQYSAVITFLAKKGMIITLFLVGMSVTTSVIRQCRSIAIVFALLLWLISTLFSLGLVFIL